MQHVLVGDARAARAAQVAAPLAPWERAGSHLNARTPQRALAGWLRPPARQLAVGETRVSDAATEMRRMSAPA